MGKYVNPSKSYLEPGDSDISRYARKIGMKTVSSFLAKDLANAFDARMNKADINFKKGLDTGEDKVRHSMDFISSINSDEFSGDSPLEKAVNCIAALQSMKGGAPKAGNADLDYYIGKNPLRTIRKLKEHLKYKKDVMNNLDDTTKDILGIEEGPMSTIESVNISPENLEIMKKISAVNKGGKIKSSKATVWKRKKTGEYKRSRRMREASDVKNLSKRKLAHPSFNIKVAKKEFSLIDRYDKEEFKQTLIMMVDYSGSMNCKEKLSWVKAIFLDRSTAAINGEAEFYVCFFIDNAYNHQKIETTEQARRWLDSFSPGGGVTNIQGSANEIFRDISTSKFSSFDVDTVERPQLVIVNDGEDHVDERWRPEFETHCFILGQENYNLKQAVVRSGGTYNRFL